MSLRQILVNENRANSSSQRRTAAASVVAAQNVDTDSNCSDGNVSSSSSSKRRPKAAAGTGSTPAAIQPSSVASSGTAAAALASTAGESACTSSAASRHTCTKEVSSKTTCPPPNLPKSRNKDTLQRTVKSDPIPRDVREKACTSSTVSSNTYRKAAARKKNKGIRPVRTSSLDKCTPTQSVDSKNVCTTTVADTISVASAPPASKFTCVSADTNKYTCTTVDNDRDTCTGSDTNKYTHTEAGIVVPTLTTSSDTHTVVVAAGLPSKDTSTPAVPTFSSSDVSPVPHRVSTSGTAEAENIGDSHSSALALPPRLPAYTCTATLASSPTGTLLAKSETAPLSEDTCTTKATEISSTFAGAGASTSSGYHSTATKATKDTCTRDEAADSRSLDGGEQDSSTRSPGLERAGRAHREASTYLQRSRAETDEVKAALLHTVAAAPITVFAYTCTAVSAPRHLNGDPCPLGCTPLAEDCVRSRAVPVLTTGGKTWTTETICEKNRAPPGDNQGTPALANKSEPNEPKQNSETPQPKPETADQKKHDDVLQQDPEERPYQRSPREKADLEAGADCGKATTETAFPDRASNDESACIAGSVTTQTSCAQGSGSSLDSSGNHRGSSRPERMEPETVEEEGDTNDSGVPESSVASFSAGPTAATQLPIGPDLETQNTFAAPSSNGISLSNDTSQSPSVLQPDVNLPPFSTDSGQEQGLLSQSPVIHDRIPSPGVEADLLNLEISAQPERQNVSSHDVLTAFLSENEIQNSLEPFLCIAESSDTVSELVRYIVESPHSNQSQDNLQTECTRLIQSSESLLTETTCPTKSQDNLLVFREENEIQAGPVSFHSSIESSHLNVVSYEAPRHAIAAVAQLVQKACSDSLLEDLRGVATGGLEDQKVLTTPVPDEQKMFTTRVSNDQKVFTTPLPGDQEGFTVHIVEDQHVLGLLSSDQQPSSAVQPKSSDHPGVSRKPPDLAVPGKVHVRWMTPCEAEASPSGDKDYIVLVSEEPKDTHPAGEDAENKTAGGQKTSEEEEGRDEGEQEEEEGLMIGGLMDVFQLDKLCRTNRSQLNSMSKRLK